LAFSDDEEEETPGSRAVTATITAPFAGIGTQIGRIRDGLATTLEPIFAGLQQQREQTIDPNNRSSTNNDDHRNSDNNASTQDTMRLFRQSQAILAVHSRLYGMGQNIRNSLRPSANN
jgi:hypothetical protein